MLDIAQDHALALLHQEGVFDLEVVLKGGTALRKFRAGKAGRFSTDLGEQGTKWAAVNPGDQWAAQQAVKSLA